MTIHASWLIVNQCFGFKSVELFCKVLCFDNCRGCFGLSNTSWSLKSKVTLIFLTSRLRDYLVPGVARVPAFRSEPAIRRGVVPVVVSEDCPACVTIFTCFFWHIWSLTTGLVKGNRHLAWEFEFFYRSRRVVHLLISPSKFGWSELHVCDVHLARQLGVGAHLAALVGLSFDRNFRERSIGDDQE